MYYPRTKTAAPTFKIFKIAPTNSFDTPASIALLHVRMRSSVKGSCSEHWLQRPGRRQSLTTVAESPALELRTPVSSSLKPQSGSFSQLCPALPTQHIF